jgi:chromosome segregation ATPase
MINESKTLQSAIKTVDSNCPDPFEQPESFSLYLAKKAESDFILEDIDLGANQLSLQSELEKLKAVKIADESLHQAEREALAAAMAQLEVFKGELEQVNRQNTAFMAQIQQLRQTAPTTSPETEKVSARNQELLAQLETAQVELNSATEELKDVRSQLQSSNNELAQVAAVKDELEYKVSSIQATVEALNSDLSQVKAEKQELESKATELTAAAQDLQIELTELVSKQFTLQATNSKIASELKAAQDQLRDYEKETLKEKAESVSESLAEEIDFKYTYLSNVILQYLQRPEQRAELIKVIGTTLHLSPEEYIKLRL